MLLINPHDSPKTLPVLHLSLLAPSPMCSLTDERLNHVEKELGGTLARFKEETRANAENKRRKGTVSCLSQHRHPLAVNMS